MKTGSATTVDEQHQRIARALAGDKAALGRLLTLAERGGPAFAAVHSALFAKVGRAYRVGVTGPPGAGKSTLVEAYALHRRGLGDTIAVVAVDPTSPFSGGALLGDRVRMNRIALDPGCFVRSMANRGFHGGLARTTDEVADVLDAAGYDRVLLETVGVGQSEVEVARSADCTVLVLVPGAGDSVQAMKAGLMEAADVFVVNKADRPGADHVIASIEEALALRDPAEPRAIVQTVATSGEGIVDLDRAIEEHRRAQLASGGHERRRLANYIAKVRRIVQDRLHRGLFEGRGIDARIEDEMDALRGRSPYEVAAALLAEAGLSEGGTT